MEQNNTVDITPENFQQVIVDGSKDKLVIVGFWTGREPVCVELMDNLSKIAARFPDDVVMAKIDVDTQTQVAMQFGVQSVPTVALLKDAKSLDSFVGVKEMAELESFLEPHLPKEQDNLLAGAKSAIEQGNYSGAFAPAKKAYEIDPERADIKMVFADVCIHSGKLDDAQALIESIRMIDQDGYYQSLVSALQLARNAAESPEIVALQQELSQNPDNFEVKVSLAVQLNQANRHEEALQQLFEVLKKDLNFGEAKKTFLDILATMPDGDPLVGTYRRKMYSLLY